MNLHKINFDLLITLNYLYSRDTQNNQLAFEGNSVSCREFGYILNCFQRLPNLLKVCPILNLNISTFSIAVTYTQNSSYLMNENR